VIDLSASKWRQYLSVTSPVPAFFALKVNTTWPPETDGAAWVVRLRSNRESVTRRSSMIKRRVTPTPDEAALTTLRRLVAVAIR
jgi:hypothetical protein